ncbi:unnamed protein product, partial [Rotaria sordida]
PSSEHDDGFYNGAVRCCITSIIKIIIFLIFLTRPGVIVPIREVFFSSFYCLGRYLYRSITDFGTGSCSFFNLTIVSFNNSSISSLYNLIDEDGSFPVLDRVTGPLYRGIGF